MENKSSCQIYTKKKKNARVQVTLDTKKKPQALGTPSDFSENTVINFSGYKTQQ